MALFGPARLRYDPPPFRALTDDEQLAMVADVRGHIDFIAEIDQELGETSYVRRTLRRQDEEWLEAHEPLVGQHGRSLTALLLRR